MEHAELKTVQDQAKTALRCIYTQHVMVPIATVTFDNNRHDCNRSAWRDRTTGDKSVQSQKNLTYRYTINLNINRVNFWLYIFNGTEGKTFGLLAATPYPLHHGSSKQRDVQ